MPLLWSYQDAPLPFPVLFVLFTVVWLLWALLCHIPRLSALTLSPHHLLQIFLTRSVVFLSYSFYRLKLFARCLPPQKWPFKKKMWEGHCSVCSLLGSLGAMLEKTLESPLDCKEIQPVHPKGDQSWVFTGRTDVESETPNTLATWCEELTHLKSPWCWERLMAGGEGDRGWDGSVASLTQWTWLWVNSGSWWWTGRPGVLRFMGSQRVRHDWATELNRLIILPCNYSPVFFKERSLVILHKINENSCLLQVKNLINMYG